MKDGLNASAQRVIDSAVLPALRQTLPCAWRYASNMRMTDFVIRPARPDDEDALWALLEPVFRDGATYAVDPGISRSDALAYWHGGGRRVFIAEDAGGSRGTCYLGPNQAGGGRHVCNAGFVTAGDAQGTGVGRAMLAAMLGTARAAGFTAMQFNFVVETNHRAIALWESFGFETVGRLPGAFRHPTRGFVDARVMWRSL